MAKRLSEYLGVDVPLAEDENVVGENAKKMAADLQDGQVMLLENVRYRAEETKNEENFSKELASLADLFVNDAFGTAHRAHCSTTGVASYLLSCLRLFDPKGDPVYGRRTGRSQAPAGCHSGRR